MKHNRSRGRTRKKNMKKTRQQTAGAYHGQGAFGVVFAEPRIPCDDEKVGELPENEVSKIFLRRAYKNAYDEANLRRRLTDGGWSESEIEKLKKYAIIPSRLCRVKNTPEENGTMWNKMTPYTSREWRTNVNNGDFMGGINLDTIPSMYPVMIISERGGNDLKAEFKKVKTTEQFYTAIIKLNNIVKGIQYLIQKDFVHSDLKNENAIVAGDQYKMIDMEDVKDVTLCNDYSIVSGAFMYFTWPSTNVFFKIIAGCVSDESQDLSSEVNQRQIKRQAQSIRRMNSKNLFNLIFKSNAGYRKFNDQNYKHTVKSLYAYSFTSEDGFTDEENIEIRAIRECYLFERTFGFVDELDMPKLQEFNNILKSDRAITTDQFKKVSSKMKDYFTDLGETNGENLSRELFVRLELHSVGIMILNLLNSFKINLRQHEKDTGENILANDETLRKNILKLHRVASKFYLQNDVVTTDPDRMEFSEKNVEDVVNLYEQLVNSIKYLIDIPSVSSASSEDIDESSEVPSSVSLTGDESSSGEDDESGEDGEDGGDGE
jgi:serine/threonine protein kinase